MYILLSNYSDNSIALIQWAKENQLENVYAVNIDTGWGAQSWQTQIERGKALATRYQFQPLTLKAKTSFVESVIDRGCFPNKKFQWCAGFIKGLTLLQWADEIDLMCEAVVLLGSRRADSRARAELPEFVESSGYFNERKVWYPLYQHTHSARDELIKRAGFTPLNQRSLECDPCIHNQLNDFQQMEAESIARTQLLENQIGHPMFDPVDYAEHSGIKQIVKWSKTQPEIPFSYESFDMGCGSYYGCGE